MGGIVIANEETDEPALVGVMKLVGGVLSVWKAHQILRGLKTLGLRMERQCENARVLAEKLRGNERRRNCLLSRIFFKWLRLWRSTRHDTFEERYA